MLKEKEASIFKSIDSNGKPYKMLPSLLLNHLINSFTYWEPGLEQKQAP